MWHHWRVHMTLFPRDATSVHSDEERSPRTCPHGGVFVIIIIIIIVVMMIGSSSGLHVEPRWMRLIYAQHLAD